MSIIPREIKDVATQCQSLEVTGDAVAWLCAQMQKYNLKYLWAHTDDGIIWGRLGQQLTISRDVAQNDAEGSKYFWAELRQSTLRTARAWSEDGELMLWRDDDEPFTARLIQDGQGKPRKYFDEPQLLWGSEAHSLKDGFTLWLDGQEKLPHALPSTALRNVQLSDDKSVLQPPSLLVRHYLSDESDDMFARIVLSRLLKLEPEVETPHD